MAKKVDSLGPTGELVRRRIKEIREARGYTFAELSRRLDEAGRPILPLGLSRIESGERRVDVDDLVALAWVLDASPTMFLSPRITGWTVPVEHTALGVVPSEAAYRWVRGSMWVADGKPELLADEVRESRRAIAHDTPDTPEEIQRRIAIAKERMEWAVRQREAETDQREIDYLNALVDSRADEVEWLEMKLGGLTRRPGHLGDDDAS